MKEIFNRVCARAMGIETGIIDFGDGWHAFGRGEIEPYNPWDNIEQLLKVITKLDIPVVVDDVIVSDTKKVLRKKVATVLKAEIKELTSANDIWIKEWESPDEDEAFKVDTTAHGDPTNIYWHAANILVLSKYRDATDFYIDSMDRYRIVARYTSADVGDSEEVQLFENEIDGFCQLLTIEAYIRDPKNDLKLWETISGANRFNPSDNTTLEDLHHHRKMLIRLCLEEMESDETRFTKQCMAIKAAGQYPGYCIDTSTFDPYNDILTLSQIVETVMGATGAPFTFHEGGMLTEMREYVETYGTEEFMSLDPLED